MQVLNLKEIQHFCQTAELGEIKKDLEEQEHPEWPLIFFAISDAIMTTVKHLESLSQLDSVDYESQKKSIQEIYRNNFFARKLIKDYQQKDDPQIKQFLNYLNTLEFSLGAAGEASEDFCKFNDSVNTTVRKPPIGTMSRYSDPEYVIDCETDQKQVLKFENNDLSESLISLLARILESFSVFRGIPLPRLIECVADLSPDFSPEFYIPNFENDSVKIQSVYNDEGEYLGTYSFPPSEDLKLPDDELNSLTEQSGFTKIQKQLSRIFERFFAENEELRTEVDCFNVRKDNLSQEGFFYFSFGFEKESPTEE